NDIIQSRPVLDEGHRYRAGALSATGSQLSNALEHGVERRSTAESTDYFANAVGTQQIPYSPPSPDDAQGDSAGGEFGMKHTQHARSRKIDIGRCREIADDRADVALLGIPQALQDYLQHVISVDIKHRGFGAKNDRMSQLLVFWMAGQIGIILR